MSFTHVPYHSPLFKKDWGSDVSFMGTRALGHLTVPHRSCLKNTKGFKKVSADSSQNGHVITTRGNKCGRVGGLQVQKVGMVGKMKGRSWASRFGKILSSTS